MATHAVLRHRPDYYLPRAAADRDDGAFQEMVGGTFDAVLPPWDLLLWCADSFLPLRGDFLDRFLTAAADPRVALVTGRSRREAACMTGLLIKKEAARRLNLSAEQPPGPGSNPDRGSGWLEERVRGIGYLVTALDDPDARIMWDTNRERLPRPLAVLPRRFRPAGTPSPGGPRPDLPTGDSRPGGPSPASGRRRRLAGPADRPGDGPLPWIPGSARPGASPSGWASSRPSASKRHTSFMPSWPNGD